MSDLWILAGQSNMEGCGNIVDVEEPHPDVKLFAHGDEWKTAEEPLHWMEEANDPVHWRCNEEDLEFSRANIRATRTKGTGAGLPFAKAVVEATGRQIDLLPVAHGGTSMSQWSPEHKSLGGHSLYGAMLRRTKLALESNPQTALKGILWYQGESDTGPDEVPLYTDRMIELVASWRADLNSPKLPVIIVQLGIFACDDGDKPEELNGWTSIREQQRTLPDKIPGLHTVPAIDLSLDDGIHISTEGLKRLGKRMAHVALREVYSQNTPKPIKIESITKHDTFVRVTYKNVTGKLVVPDPDGRIPGYGIWLDGKYTTVRFYKTTLDSNDPRSILIHYEGTLDSNAKIGYGEGFFPFCQLIDEADMAAPAFGPVRMD